MDYCQLLIPKISLIWLKKKEPFKDSFFYRVLILEKLSNNHKNSQVKCCVSINRQNKVKITDIVENSKFC